MVSCLLSCLHLCEFIKQHIHKVHMCSMRYVHICEFIKKLYIISFSMQYVHTSVNSSSSISKKLMATRSGYSAFVITVAAMPILCIYNNIHQLLFQAPLRLHTAAPGYSACVMTLDAITIYAYIIIYINFYSQLPLRCCYNCCYKQHTLLLQVVFSIRYVHL
jgi:hypothetical protein